MRRKVPAALERKIVARTRRALARVGERKLEGMGDFAKAAQCFAGKAPGVNELGCRQRQRTKHCAESLSYANGVESQSPGS